MSDSGFTTVRTVGGLLPADVLAAASNGRDLPGMTADDYQLELGITPREAANRSWATLLGAWRGYRAALDKLPPHDRATTLTRDKWLFVLLREMGFGHRPNQAPAGGFTAEDRTFPVSHVSDDVPMHLLGWHVPLDTRTSKVLGAADRAPHAMLQEFLNRSDDHLWAILSNGKLWRLLRDSTSIVGAAYVEFDLEAMFDGEVYADFVLFYVTCHRSRFQPVDPELGMADCWLEKWRAYAAETGTRALAELRLGVRNALVALGTGFTNHPANTELRHRLDTNDATADDLKRSLLRVIYRMLFCFVAEDRGLLLDPSDHAATARKRYGDWFSTARLRRISTRRRGGRHGDQWQALSIVFNALGDEAGRPELALVGLGGLFERGAADMVEGCELSNESLLTAVRSLSVVQPAGGPKRVVDYRNLGSEELGSVYESLLELVPRYDPITHQFSLEEVAGNERKKTGSYYTPTSLISCLLDSALDPLLDEAERAAEPDKALLALTVCDPACGSGHFLVAAARRIAVRLARVRCKDIEPTVLDEQAAMFDVVSHCIYGVDLNDMAAELAKVSLWLEAVVPGRSLGFLDAHIKVGNALLGVTPSLLAAGLPDDAFAAIGDDDKKIVGGLRKANKTERTQVEYGLFSPSELGVGSFGESTIAVENRALAARLATVEAIDPTSLADVHLAARRFRDLENAPDRIDALRAANTWCAAFVAPKRPGAPDLTHRAVLAAAAGTLSPERVLVVDEIARRYRFFHWHLEFPNIFRVTDTSAGDGPGWEGGFSCVLGNPPWERVKLQEQEFFAARDPKIATAPNAAARKRLIAELDPASRLAIEFAAEKRRAEGESHLLRNSGRYPLCGQGDINTFSVFAEHGRSVLAPTGRLGIIVPTGIATDATTASFFRSLVESRSLVSLYSFENERLLFPGVHHAFKFALLVLTGRSSVSDQASFAFYCQHPDDLARQSVRFALTPEEITLVNPNTGTSPVFRTRRDAELTLAIYRRLPILVSKLGKGSNPWGLSFMTMLHMSGDSGQFRTAVELEMDGWTLQGNIFNKEISRYLPLYEAKMAHHFDHRWATYDGDDTSDVTLSQKVDREFVVLPHYWVPESVVSSRLASRWDRDWLFGWRRIARATDARTIIAPVIPLAGATDKFVLNFGPRIVELISLYSSFVFDYVARQKVAGTQVDFFTAHQLPVLPPERFDEPCQWSPTESISEWLKPRVLELTYTALDLAGFAADLGYYGQPFVWDDEHRAHLRAEIDACFFHLYGLTRDEADYVLSTFPIVAKNDIKAHGEERTRRLILTAYNSLDELSTYR